MTTHTVSHQRANVSQQGSSAETKPVVRRIEKSEPIIFDLRQGGDELEDQVFQVIHFYDGDDDDEEPEMQEVEEMSISISDDEPILRRLGEENEDVAIIIDSGADVALFPLSTQRPIQRKDQATRRTSKSHPHRRCEKCSNFLART